MTEEEIIKKFNELKNENELIRKELSELKQHIINVEVEVFFPIAQAEMADKTIKRRITLNGVVSNIVKSITEKTKEDKKIKIELAR